MVLKMKMPSPVLHDLKTKVQRQIADAQTAPKNLKTDFGTCFIFDA